jgi:hypothetical protein
MNLYVNANGTGTSNVTLDLRINQSTSPYCYDVVNLTVS